MQCNLWDFSMLTYLCHLWDYAPMPNAVISIRDTSAGAFAFVFLYVLKMRLVTVRTMLILNESEQNQLPRIDSVFWRSQRLIVNLPDLSERFWQLFWISSHVFMKFGSSCAVLKAQVVCRCAQVHGIVKKQ